jgi:hypothetical protein
MDCKQFRTKHLAYLDDSLSSHELAAAQLHVMRCDACAAYDTTVRRSLMVARSVPALAPSDAFRQALQARLATCRAEIAADTDAAYTDAAARAHRPRLIQHTPGSGFRPSRALMAVAASAVLGVLAYRAMIDGRESSLRMQPMTAARPTPLSPLIAQEVGLTSLDSSVSNELWPAPVLLHPVPPTPSSLPMAAGFSLVSTGR